MAPRCLCLCVCVCVCVCVCERDLKGGKREERGEARLSSSSSSSPSPSKWEEIDQASGFKIEPEGREGGREGGREDGRKEVNKSRRAGFFPSWRTLQVFVRSFFGPSSRGTTRSNLRCFYETMNAVSSKLPKNPSAPSRETLLFFI